MKETARKLSLERVVAEHSSSVNALKKSAATLKKQKETTQQELASQKSSYKSQLASAQSRANMAFGFAVLVLAVAVGRLFM